MSSHPITFVEKTYWKELQPIVSIPKELIEILDMRAQHYLDCTGLTKETVLNFIESQHDCTFFLAVSKGIVVGIAYFYDYWPEWRRCNIAYAIKPDLRHKGCGYLVAESFVRYVRSTYKINRVGMEIEPDNSFSLKIAKKLGFIMEGELRSYYKPGSSVLVLSSIIR